MASNESIANLKADLVEVYIDDDLAPILAEFYYKVGETWVPFRNARTGTTPVATVITGHTFEGRFVLNQATGAELRIFKDLASSGAQQPAAIGSQVTTHVLRIHDPQDGASEANDIFVYAAKFMQLESTQDGEGEKQYTVPIEGEQDSAGKVWSIGEVA